jgi:hypothetical protein
LNSNVICFHTSPKRKRYSTPVITDVENTELNPASSAMMNGSGLNNKGEPPFEIRGFSLGNVVILLGISVTVLSFVEYLGGGEGEGLTVSGLGFVYGLPIFLAGAALKYAEINPVPCYSTPGREQVFEEKATEIIRKIKQDVTRHRYGDEAHLDTTVKRLGLVIAGKEYPQLKELREDMSDDGELVFTMVWQSLDTPYKMWNDPQRVKKYSTFFGKGVKGECVKIDAEQRFVGIQLTTVSNKVDEDEDEHEHSHAHAHSHDEELEANTEENLITASSVKSD